MIALGDRLAADLQRCLERVREAQQQEESALVDAFMLLVRQAWPAMSRRDQENIEQRLADAVQGTL